MTAMPHNQGHCKPDCFGCKASGISFAPSAMPTRSDAGAQEAFTQQRHKDVAAYKRLRADGLQPKSTTGAASLEARADSKWEVETGQMIGNASISRQLDEVQSAINKGETVVL
jgi:hypothetical protein